MQYASNYVFHMFLKFLFVIHKRFFLDFFICKICTVGCMSGRLSTFYVFIVLFCFLKVFFVAVSETYRTGVLWLVNWRTEDLNHDRKDILTLQPTAISGRLQADEKLAEKARQIISEDLWSLSVMD